MTGGNDPFGWLNGINADTPDSREMLQDAEEQRKEMARLQRAEARLFFDVFSTGRGPELLEFLRNRTIELDLMSVTPVIGNELREMGVGPAEWAYHRNGQNSVIRFIETMCREAMRPEAEEETNG